MEPTVGRSSSTATWVTIFFIIIAPFENIARVEKIYYILAVLILSVCLLKMRTVKQDFTLLLPCFVIYALISTMWSVNTNAINELFNFSVVMFFLYLQLQFDYEYFEFQKIKTAFIIQGGILVILCFRFGSYMDNRFWLQSTTSGADPNYLSGWFIIPLCFIVERLFEHNVRLIYKIVMIAEIFCFFYFIMQSASRSGLIANAMALAICILYAARSTVRIHPIRAIVLVAALIFIVYIGFQYMPETMLNRLMGSNSGLGGRSDIWVQLWKVMMSHPLGIIFGMGSNSTSYYNTYKMVSHNTFFDIWFQYGIAGLLMIVTFIFKSVNICIKKRPYAVISFASMCILIFVLSALTTRFVMLSFFVLGAYVIDDREYGLKYAKE